MRVQARTRTGIHVTRIRRTARHALQLEHRGGQITIVLVSDAQIRKLNRDYHALDSSTDILTFPFDSDYLGDLVISVGAARVNARLAHWTLADELDLLIVHGILHLLGYDDVNSRVRKKMWKHFQKSFEKKGYMLGEPGDVGEAAARLRTSAESVPGTSSAMHSPSCWMSIAYKSCMR